MQNGRANTLSALTLPLVLIVLLFTVACGDTQNREVPVGRVHLALNDEQRLNWSGDGPRPLGATVWYPASSDSSEEQWKAGVFHFGHSALNAPFADSSERPLIVLSHGTGGSAAQLSWLAEHLVVGGNIVAAVNHHGNTAVEDKQWLGGFVLPSDRSRDLSVLIDKLLEHSEIGPRIDLNRIGAAGFSLGGYSVLGLVGIQLPSFEEWQRRCKKSPESSGCQLPPEADFNPDDIGLKISSDQMFQSGVERAREAVSDNRIQAVYSIAPALLSLMNEADLSSNVQATVKVILAEKDDQIALYETKQFLEESVAEVQTRIIEKASHYVFLAPCNIRGKLFVRSLCNDPWGINRPRLHAEVGRDAVEFFRLTLRD